VRQQKRRPLADAFEAGCAQSRPSSAKRKSPLKSSATRSRAGRGLTGFIDDGRTEPDNNMVKRLIRSIKLSRKNALFAGSDGGSEHWAIIASYRGL
jgi:hypothetical protein